MPVWPFRRSVSGASPPVDDGFLTEQLLRRAVDDVFAVREGYVRSGIVVYRGQLLLPAPQAVDRLMARFRPFGFTPFIRAEGGEIVLQALPLADVTVRARIGVNVALFVLTCVSTLLAGLAFVGSPTFDALRTAPGWIHFLTGVPFAATLLAILGVHEFGHYFTARRYGASVSLPYFIPAPPPIFLFGTLGAVIRMRSPAKDRNALFDIAAAGPLAGLAVALPALLLGLAWSSVQPLAPGQTVFGQSLLMRLLVMIRFGQIPAGMTVFTHPIADAAWVGFLVTALNLFPVGQLDGGRIAYALFGRRHLAVGKAALAATLLFGLVVLAWNVLVWGGDPFASLNWFVWAAVVFFLVGLHHSPPLDDVTPLTPARRFVGIACLVLLVLLIPPIPIQIG